MLQFVDDPAYDGLRLTDLTPNRHGVLALHGYGLRLHVEKGHLCLEDGIADERRTARLAKATTDLSRLVIVGTHGYVTLDALRWLHEVGAGVLVLTTTGEVVLASAPRRLEDVRLRRVQATLPGTPLGLDLIRGLLHDKLTGQLAMAERLGAAVAATYIKGRLDRLPKARELTELRQLESRAAGRYWLAWATLPTRFATNDLGRVPDHWLTFGDRASPLTDGPRLAANPANAVLNYLYAILEGTTEAACRALGLDPGMGVLHADERARASFALDVMEAVRPTADRYLHDLLTRRTFARDDLIERRDGCCQLTSKLAAELAEATAATFERAVAPVTERVAAALAQGYREGSRWRLRPPTKLSGARRVAAQDPYRGRGVGTAGVVASVAATCAACGGPVPARDRTYCDGCLPEQEPGDRGLVAAHERLAALRAVGADPSKTPAALRKLGERQRERLAEARAWDAEHKGAGPVDAYTWEHVIRPGLERVSLGNQRRATGLSVSYLSMVRAGKRTPHPRHWEPLLRLVERDRAGGGVGLTSLDARHGDVHGLEQKETLE